MQETTEGAVPLQRRVRPLRVLSLGAGVQSSTLALMAAHGEIEPVQHAIFADTQVEPRKVYEWLDWLDVEIQRCPHPFPVHRVTQGNLEADFLAALTDPKGRCGQPPFMVWNHDKSRGVRIWRKCTKDYKLTPIRRKVRELSKGAAVDQVIGISLDEAHRMKPSGVGYITNVYPLVDRRMSRHDCIRWMQERQYPEPPKSACTFCPYSNNARFRAMRDHEPEDWARLVWFDAEMRRLQAVTINGAKITGTLYVHRDCKPIGDVDLSTPEDWGQSDMFGNECEGMCGV